MSSGIEGTGSYGARIAALLAAHGLDVLEINRPDRQLRRRRGKTDTVDAEAAARSALNGHARGLAKSHDGIVDSIRLHRLTLTTLRKSRTALINTLRSVLVTAPAAIRDELEPLTAVALFTRCAGLRVEATPCADPEHAAKQTLRALARHIAALDDELDRLRAGLTMLAESANPETDREILRCLKRHIAREIYHLQTQPRSVIGTQDLRPTRLQLGLPMQTAADQLGVSLPTISRTERGIKPNHQFANTYRSWLNTRTASSAA